MTHGKQPRRAFPYFGSKSRIAKHYPEPLHDIIVEPFAGAAAYSQRHWERAVHLFDLSPLVVGAWQFLIDASPADVLSLPDVSYKTDAMALPALSHGEKALIQLHAYDGLDCTGRLTGKRCLWNRNKKHVAELVQHFKHWKVFQTSYSTLPNGAATWFVDPPYQHGGENYTYGNKSLDFAHLGAWCMERVGQLIVCENTKADWLPFEPVVVLHGVKHTTMEAAFIR